MRTILDKKNLKTIDTFGLDNRRYIFTPISFVLKIMGNHLPLTNLLKLSMKNTKNTKETKTSNTCLYQHP